MNSNYPSGVTESMIPGNRPGDDKELLDQIETLKAKIDKLQDRLSSGRDYLMGVEPEFLSAEDALESFGYGRNGLNS